MLCAALLLHLHAVADEPPLAEAHEAPLNASIGPPNGPQQQPQRRHGQGDDFALSEGPQSSRDAAELALALASAALRALAEPAADLLSADPATPPWHGAAAELARGLLAEGRLAELFARPSVTAALARELRGVRCTSNVSTSDEEAASSQRWHRRADAASPAAASQSQEHPKAQGAAEGSYVAASTNQTRAATRRARSAMAQQPTPPARRRTQSVEDGAALLQGFVRDPRGGAAWAALRGWRNGSDPCELSSAREQAWTGIDCSDPTRHGRVVAVILRHYPDLRFELLGSALVKLDHLRVFAVTGTALSGTIPRELYYLVELETLLLHSNVALSGTIPSELGDLAELQTLALYGNPALSGTIPSELGRLKELQKLDLNSNMALSGTIPSELGRLKELQQLHLESNPALCGTIPSELGGLQELQQLHLESNPALCGTIPSELGALVALRYMYLHSILALSGTVPSLTGCKHLEVLDLHNCSLTALPASLPASITHLYLDHNPIDAHLADLSSVLGSVSALRVLDVGFINSKVQLEQNRVGADVEGGSYGTRVANPGSCRIDTPCAFVLAMYDDYGESVHQGGLLHNLTLRLGGLSAPMVDNRDGTFTAAIPNGWVTAVGSYMFEFAHSGQDFRPMMSGPTTIATADDCDADVGGVCAGLRTVEFLPRDCPAVSHTRPDEVGGATCVCRPDFILDGNTNSTNSTNSCHRDCHHHLGETVSRDGGSCECSENHYDVRKTGVLLCTTGDWRPEGGLKVYTDAAALVRNGSKCLACPAECVSCKDGGVTLDKGWRLDGKSLTEIRDRLGSAADTQAQFAYRCPNAAYGDDPCPQLRLDTIPKTVETETNKSYSRLCAGHHTGRLCFSCEQGFSRRTSDGTCNPCGTDGIEEHFGVSGQTFALLVAVGGASVVAMVCLQKVRLKQAKVQVCSLVKIALGLAQVLSLLKDCLNILYPSHARHAMSYTALFTADVSTLVQFDCRGWAWFDTWLLRVVGAPCFAMCLVALRYLWQRNRGEKEEALSNAVKSLFLVVLLLYPQVSSTIMSALRCRALGATVSVLEVDYAVSCLDPRYLNYRLAAWLLLAVWPVGIPVGLLGLLWRHWRRNAREYGSTRALDVIDNESFALYSKSKLSERYGFCLDDYRPQCWYFEPVDMLRKLALSGLLQFIERGTAAQVFVGCGIAFFSFGVHVRLLPYLQSDSNVLKLAAEALIFMTFLISFVLRVLPRIETFEPLNAKSYDYVLLGAFAAFAALFVGLVARQVYRHRRFQQGFTAFVGSAFSGEHGEGGHELGILTRGTSGHAALLGGEDSTMGVGDGLEEREPEPESELEPEPEPEPEP